MTTTKPRLLEELQKLGNDNKELRKQENLKAVQDLMPKIADTLRAAAETGKDYADLFITPRMNEVLQEFIVHLRDEEGLYTSVSSSFLRVAWSADAPLWSDSEHS